MEDIGKKILSAEKIELKKEKYIEHNYSVDIVYILSGVVQIDYYEFHHTYNDGDILIIPSGVTYSLTPTGVVSFIQIELDYSFSLDILGEFSGIVCDSKREVDRDYIKLKNIVVTLYNEFATNNEINTLMLNSIL
ncbi:MAG: hypothetical protein LBM02_03865, partial [Lachnospiraceae bacterium]|nr:hypothetical protein [Lachnospiraceae bacterium]